ncbi:peptidoglycan transpeptidase precursor, ErfK-YbiS-YhnG family [Rhodococcoides kroppenstedtii]|uniref:Peptidoglycan transpeptidase, ErfK-YbiS-YhnG family n=2 Tax=Rhodococcoides kroppenstedtii TaxID=293050 RepID=A0A1I0SKB1_9NOCA|nr:peptidoglycan transpeptidase precursor, ErfK-YbiS-YhnG family [Rhodococcus kroppenstedtii]
MKVFPSVAAARGRVVLVASAAVMSLVVAGCTAGAGDDAAAPPAPIDSNPLSELMKPKVTLPAPDASVGFSPSAPVTVSVVDGSLSRVTLTDSAGQAVDGTLAADRASWTATAPLDYNETYTVDTRAYGLGGEATSTTSFTTTSPGNLTKPYLLPSEGEVVGVGQPVAVQFDEPVPDKVAAQNAITVTTNPPVEGAFYWVNQKEVRWRPQNYWVPGTTVDVAVDVFGRDLGDGLFGQENARSSFTIGDAVIAVADDATKQVTFTVNGEQVMTMPTSMGKNSSPTPNGVYTIGDKFASMVMDSSTYGVPVDSAQGYRTPVDWATRMSYSGIFFHSAPWSVGSQGYTNVSHGCLNLSPANAKWVYDNMKRGDITIVKNTVGGTLPGTDGLGDWNIPWEEWKAGNAQSV